MSEVSFFIKSRAIDFREKICVSQVHLKTAVIKI